MLTHLSITNYAIIEQIDIDFNNGFTVITGETGAGKSILLGAISLILGNRSDTSILNNKEKKCIVEGTFLLTKEKFNSFFLTNDLDFDAETLVRREISKTGKSRAFINDTPVTLNVLKNLTSQLIDVHSQHQTLKLQNNQFQIDVVDSFANINEDLKNYKEKYKLYKGKQKILFDLLNKEATDKSDLAYLQFQINEIEELNLQPNEQEHIQNQLAIINNAESIKTTLEKVSYTLSSSESNTVGSLKEVVNSYAQIIDYGEKYVEQHQRLQSLLIELEDVSLEIDEDNNSFEFDPENAQYLNQRLSTIYSLEQKHMLNNSDELLNLLNTLTDQLKAIDSTETEIKKLQEALEIEGEQINKLAQQISKKRNKIIPELEKTIISILCELGMPEATFIVKQSILEDVDLNGIDQLQFLFSANKGFKEKELEKAASGGELSRLMLAIKSVLATNSNISTILFDEIDTGVSGDIADKMAVIMKEMSNDIQIISITHLPQVAAKGDSHIKIYKETIGNKTATFLKVLTKTDRVEEIAKMLSGKNTSSIAKENAKILLRN
jgi:DNA repair protein RecN (Recombination protein N)